MELGPDKRLIIKGYYILFTLTGMLVVVAVILNFTLPLIPEVEPGMARNYIWGWTGFVVIIMWITSVPIMLLWIRNLAYFIEEERITIHKGIITKVQQNIPYRAITDFQLHRTLYDRVLGIGALRIQTAGQSQNTPGFEGKLSGLTDWQNLQDELRARVRHYHQAKISSAEDEQSPSVSTKLLQEILQELRAIRQKNNAS